MSNYILHILPFYTFVIKLKILMKSEFSSPSGYGSYKSFLANDPKTSRFLNSEAASWTNLRSLNPVAHLLFG